MSAANGWNARWFAVVVALQAAFLLGWAGWHEWNRGHAPTILLETVPVDPRDLLRGDYMILSYKISRVPEPAVAGLDARGEGDTARKSGREIWVRLRKNGRFHEVIATSWNQPRAEDTAAGTVVVRGRTAGPGSARELRVVYEIEKFFVPEGKGTPRFKEMVVEATVSAGGQLGIKRVLLDGKTFP